MGKIGLVEAIDALRSELAEAVEKAQGQEIQFPIGSVQLEFQVGVTIPTLRIRIFQQRAPRRKRRVKRRCR